MSIASEITRLQGVKSDILTAIADKGVTVPSGSMLADCPELIAAISGGDVSVSTRMIASKTGINVVDANGYIGLSATNYFPYSGYSYYNNFAIVVAGADFSSKGLGRVTFLQEGTVEIGGRTYRTENIGGVEWMCENLDYKFSGCAIGSGVSSTEARGNYYNDDETTYGEQGNKYGLLYNWIAVKLLNDNRSTLCPGWHVPTTAEWDAVATAVGGASTAGTYLKSTTGWSSGAGTDAYGFSAFPAGYRNGSGSFFNLGSYAGFWTATESSSSRAHYRYFGTGASMGSYTDIESYGYSVRLVKD